jgi:hypothetical protein
VTVVLQAPSTAGAATTCPVGSDSYLGSVGTLSFEGLPAFCITGRWSANGAPSSDGGTSHGDYFNWFDGAGLSSDAINFRGRFVYLDGQKIVANDLNVGSSNKQGTQATVNDLNIPVTVQDGPNVPSICTTTILLNDGSTFDCTTLTSETSVVDVDFGNTVKLFPILVKFNQAPTNLKGNAPFAIHQYVVPGSNPLQTITEKISASCVLKNGVPTAASPIPCLTVANGGKQVTIWNDHNGKFQF